MRITKYGHSCLHIVDGPASILIDPGTFSQGFETLSGLTAILVTHQHADHVDPKRLPLLLRGNPDATLYADAGSVELLAKEGITPPRCATGDKLDVGISVEVFAGDHAVIHRDVPVIPNAMYLVGGRLLHPGDSLVEIDRPVEILALPVFGAVDGRQGGRRVLPGGRPEGGHPDPREGDGQHGDGLRPADRLGPAGARWLNLDDGHFENL